MKAPKKTLSLRKQPNQERAIETMESILQATAHILEEDGYDKASTNKIAAKAGVSIGSLYQYFPTKESILSLMMDKYMKREMDILDKILKEKNSRDLYTTIKDLIEAMLESKKKNRRFTKIFAQKLFGFNKIDSLKDLDTHILQLFKEHIKPFEHELRKENLELSLFMCIQCVKIIPVSILLQDKFDLNQPAVLDEMVHLIYQFLKKS